MLDGVDREIRFQNNDNVKLNDRYGRMILEKIIIVVGRPRGGGGGGALSLGWLLPSVRENRASAGQSS